MSRRTYRLTALALGAFGFSAALTATAGIPNCDHCVHDYYLCRENTPDANPSCVEQFFDCQVAGRCEPTLPPD
ncbi:hypothetical protein J5226_20685 [Lysobacter sp. K5869]|uniref:hypothetical protein n=1 Tax=Lysobacter sp. K5869 TaxID=2820808 RepID=UPI001C0602AF|nr:hypothetical protein [Lysobacter sp. K5869]QWP75993.1 hypothetical protein J5226_20685 [Lysobacter sp. K5869]